MASGSAKPLPIPRAENSEKWIRSAGGSAAVRRSVLAAVARIEALEAKNHTRYDQLPEKQA